MNYLNSRAHRVIAGILLVLVVALTVGVVIGTHGNSQQKNTNFYTGGNNAPVPANSSSVSAWYDSTGQTDMQAVSTDLGQLQTDADAGDTYSAETDGQTLATDAQTAADDPPPVEGAQYQNAMSTLVTAGNDAADGDFTDSTAALETATGEINSITAYLQANGG